MTEPLFDGGTFSRGLDAERLSTQLGKTYAAMFDGEWRTLSELSSLGVPGSLPGISARLRDFRKKKNRERGFACYALLRRRRGKAESGLWEYRLVSHFGRMTKEDWSLISPRDPSEDPPGIATQLSLFG